MTTSTATKPLSLPDISKLFQNAAQDVATFDHLADKDPRQKALAIAQSLVATLENPNDVIMRYACEVPSDVPLDYLKLIQDSEWVSAHVSSLGYRFAYLSYLGGEWRKAYFCHGNCSPVLSWGASHWYVHSSRQNEHTADPQSESCASSQRLGSPRKPACKAMSPLL